jgi:hypothetical protein
MTATDRGGAPPSDGPGRALSWTAIWRQDGGAQGLEHLLLRAGSADSVILAFDERGRPFRLAYQLTWDEGWRVRDARLRATTESGTRSLALDTDGQGRWRDGEGHALPALDGCLDLDLWPTPFTNTLPVRRHPLAVGERQEFLVAWVAAPALGVQAMRQGYTRLADRRYRYESLDGTGFRAELSVDAQGVVLDYEGVFRRVG